MAVTPHVDLEKTDVHVFSSAGLVSPINELEVFEVEQLGDRNTNIILFHNYL